MGVSKRRRDKNSRRREEEKIEVTKQNSFPDKLKKKGNKGEPIGSVSKERRDTRVGPRSGELRPVIRRKGGHNQLAIISQKHHRLKKKGKK